MAAPHSPSSDRTPTRIDVGNLEPKVSLSISTPELAFIVVKARAFDAEVPPNGTEDGSDMADDRAVAALESTPDNPSRAELTAALRGFNVDQLNEVLALVFVGRGDFAADEWKAALAQARELDPRRAVKDLVGTPLLGDLIEDGLDEMGYNITNEEMIRS